MTEILTDPSAWAALVTLTVLEVVLGIDNIIFLSIITGKLPREQRQSARVIGLALAMIMRILLLLSLSWLMRLTEPLFAVMSHPVSGRDLVLIIGGLFLLGKSTMEIHDSMEEGGHEAPRVRAAAYVSALVQIMLLDIVFSLDSVITAIGMSDQLVIMITAVVVAVVFMMLFAAGVSCFVEDHPTVKMLALSFLLLVGFTLVADGVGFHIPKGYIYFAMAFSVFVEFLNLKVRRRRTGQAVPGGEPS